MEPITRPEFNETISRIHQRVDEISKTTTQIETSAKMMETSVNKMCECIYGNGKSGLTSRITQLFERVSLHTKLISMLMLSIIGLAFYIIQTYLKK
jgi:hypothetical protein